MMNFNLRCSCGKTLLSVTNCNHHIWWEKCKDISFECSCGLKWGLGRTDQYQVMNDAPSYPASNAGLTVFPI